MVKALRDWVGKVCFRLALPFGIASSLVTSWVKKFRLQAYVHRRGDVIRSLAEPPELARPRTRLCVGIAHIVSEQEVADPVLGAPKLERLRQTLDGVLVSFADCDLTIFLSSLPGRNLVPFLPDYQRLQVELIEGPDWEPMFVEFRMQDEFLQRADGHDWFLFLEDNLCIHDGDYLRKMQEFHRHAGPGDLLMPHRYEYVDGVKRYIDLNIDSALAWNRHSAITIGGMKFCEFTNAHSATYCMTREQLRQWDRTGRAWRNQVIWVGPLESAATFCLLEKFRLFKPHSSNLSYLEILHWDTKYSRLYPTPKSPYTLSRPAGLWGPTAREGGPDQAALGPAGEVAAVGSVGGPPGVAAAKPTRVADVSPGSLPAPL